jgi:hypothetical protein
MSSASPTRSPGGTVRYGPIPRVPLDPREWLAVIDEMARRRNRACERTAHVDRGSSRSAVSGPHGEGGMRSFPDGIDAGGVQVDGVAAAQRGAPDGVGGEPVRCRNRRSALACRTREAYDQVRASRPRPPQAAPPRASRRAASSPMSVFPAPGGSTTHARLRPFAQAVPSWSRALAW